MSSEDITETTSWNSHDQPIHLSGSIQPHGLLLALDTELDIWQVSNNTEKYLDKQPQELLGQRLGCLLATQQVAAIKQCLEKKIGSVTTLKIPIATVNGERYFDGIAHRTTNAIILELEPRDSDDEVSFLGFHGLVSEAIANLQNTSNLEEFLHLVASEYRKITAFDRVMVYQFDEQGAGSVVAEVKREELPPYLGLHYPATDIPEPARQLYMQCLLRFIPNFTAQPVELISQNSADTTPVDLSWSVLRSVDPCCVAYHQNMGAAAILVIALIKNQQLWGLISCHHQTPKYLTYEVRKICEFLGQIVSLELGHKVIHSELDYEVKLKSLQSEFVELISQADNFIDALVKPQPSLLALVSATGAAVCLDNEITLVGETPDIEQVRSLIAWVDNQVSQRIFATDSLPKLYPEAIQYKNTASGLLLLRISQIQRYYILWFRPEVLQTVNWAGNPNASIQTNADGSVILCPRTSFEQWQETVQLTSLPWKQCEIDNALTLKNAIVGIVLSKAEELAKINQELERSNRELASFAYAASHDLKEPLRGIYNFSTILIEDYAAVLDEDGLDYLQTVLALSVRMETLINSLLRLSQLGQTQLHLTLTNLNELVNQVIDVINASRQEAQINVHIPRPLPTVQCDSVLINEVFSNLIINALKYNDKPEALIEIGFISQQESPNIRKNTSYPVFYVKDNSIGIHEHHYQTIFRLFKRLHSQEKYGGGTGAGLAISKKIVELHSGQIWVESSVGIGSTFYFTLGQ
ncbi:GAF domain-containing protein [Nostoc sp. FACHB-152]|uniref:ATP-binding protein n=1 Tax=unclassified Nostoc TaxID=2593658 RepID=UPI001687EABB|nr:MULTISPECIES: ATP-binding protein [unclassified Nostoc]MBD2445587.1 GAF domain-containing protein [Nostoc sp. FACHB-152]MBD2466699.1 GAF domain-containing protein [Nostoc sp. FACHB-145]